MLFNSNCLVAATNHERWAIFINAARRSRIGIVELLGLRANRVNENDGN